VVPWANGLGTTAVIVRVPDTDAWSWRLSLADVAVDGPFSALPGIDRWIAVARGAGMELTVEGRGAITLTSAEGPFAFSGDAITSCRLFAGPIVDVNLMLRRGAAAGRLEIESVPAGARSVVADASALVVLGGTVRWGETTLDEFDALVADVPSETLSHRHAGSGQSCALIATTDARLAVIHVTAP
jgi:uncharacterized protein